MQYEKKKNVFTGCQISKIIIHYIWHKKGLFKNQYDVLTFILMTIKSSFYQMLW